MEVEKQQAEPFRSACCFILFPQEKKAPINSSVSLPSFFRHESLHEQYTPSGSFFCAVQNHFFPVDAQTPFAPHSGTESRRSTETRTAQSGAASEDSAHGCQFASAAASPSQTPSPQQTRPDVSRPTQRDESSHTGGQTATRRQSPHTSGHPRSGTRTRRKSPYHPPEHAVRRRHIAAKHFVRRIPRLPLVRIALRRISGRSASVARRIMG